MKEMSAEMRKALAWMIGFLGITGGLSFTVGSIVYWPSIAQDVNPNIGGILFIIGSTFYFSCDIIAGFMDP